MKSFTRIKKIKGKEYLYEITPYYDPETKQSGIKANILVKIHPGQSSQNKAEASSVGIFLWRILCLNKIN